MLVVLAAAAGEGGGGMPQFNPEFYTSQLFWLAVCFVALYVILSKVALPRIGEVLDERRARIQRDLEEAESMKSETEQALAAYEKALGDARGRAQGIAKDTRDRLMQAADQEKAAAEATISAKMADTERRIADTKSKALASVGDIAADTASAIVARLIGKEPQRDEVMRAMQPQAGE